MNHLISVVIPTHNPHPERFLKTLEGLKHQTLSSLFWELIIIDNASPNKDFIYSFDISWHQNAKIIYEERLGLTRARIAGIKATNTDHIVFVDDDNILQPDYLEKSLEILNANPLIGALGGKSIPLYSQEPPSWFEQNKLALGCRDFGNQIEIYIPRPNDPIKNYPKCSPIGAGMVLRKSALLAYVTRIESCSDNLVLDRTGKSLTSGGDCDINLTILNENWGVGYFPELVLTHLIPEFRLTKNYLARLNYASSKSWIRVLDSHNIRPWQPIPHWSVIPRQLKSFFSCQAWKSPSAFIEWRGTCGMFEGLAALPMDRRL
ncbi:MAG: glycosyltransferase [Dolichospermum sp. UKL201]|jgi:glycosyltransferase involved in cell wall biosynthesis|nr:MAG: glycosyltransferase [Dolichospermum sp. UKL201]